MIALLFPLGVAVGLVMGLMVAGLMQAGRDE